MKFLFWNINKKNLTSLLIEACEENDIDILGVCEMEKLDIKLLETELNFKERKVLEDIKPERVKLFSKREIEIEPVNELKAYYKSFQYKKGEKDYNLILLHLPSKLYQDEKEQLSFSTRARSFIQETNERIGTNDTIVFGDFNMNPFESGIISSEGFFALNSKKEVQKGKIVTYGETRKVFFNPSWQLFHNKKNGTQGSYYFREGIGKNHCWNVFDQVLISSPLLGKFVYEEFKILYKIKDKELYNLHGRPDKIKYSDHFPIIFKLNI